MAVKMVATTRVLEWSYQIANQTLVGAGEGGTQTYLINVRLEKPRCNRVPDPTHLDGLVRTALGVKREPHDLACFLASETECRVQIDAGLIGSAGTFFVTAGF